MTMRFKSFGMWGNTPYKEPTPGPYCCNPSTFSDFSGNANSRLFNVKTLADGNILLQGFILGTYSGSSISNSIVIDKCGNLVKSLTPTLSDGNFASNTQLSNNKLIIGTQGLVYGYTSGYTQDPTFSNGGTYPSANRRIYTVNRMAGDKVFIAGNFNNYQVTGGTIYSGFTNVALLNTNGVPDMTYQPSFTFAQSPKAWNDNSDKIILYGASVITGTSVYNLVRLNSDGTYDNTFSGITQNNSQINVISQQSDGKYIVAGTFTLYNGISNQNYLVRLNTNGSLDTTFVNSQQAAYPSQTIYSIYVLPNDKILIGNNTGNFYRLNSDGSLDNSFWVSTDIYPISTVNNTIQGITIDSEGSIWAGGSFYQWNGYYTGKLVKLYSNGILNQCVTPAPTPTPTQTPTATVTKTPTPTPSASIAVTPTTTSTNTPTPTITPTNTVTPTVTRTQTPTPTISPFYDIVFYDSTAFDVCNNPFYGFPMTGNNSTYCNSTRFTNSSWVTIPTGTYYLLFSGNTRTVTHTFGQTYADTIDSGCQACVSPTPTNTVTPTPTITPSPTPLPIVNLISDSVDTYQYTLSGNTIAFKFSPGYDKVGDIAIGNNNFYTYVYLVDDMSNPTGFTINQYSSTLNPIAITSGITNSWTVVNGTYSGLDYSNGLEVKDNNTLLIGGSSIYSFNISGGTFTKLFDLPYPESYVIGDMIYNPYTQRIIILVYGQTYTDFYLSEFYLNGTLYAEYNITGDFSGDTPASLFVNNNNLYIVTEEHNLVYNYNLTSNTVSYVQTMTGITYSSGMAAPNQNNNVSLTP